MTSGTGPFVIAAPASATKAAVRRTESRFRHPERYRHTAKTTKNAVSILVQV